MQDDTFRSASELPLAAEWDQLVRSCPGFYVGQTCQWAETAWRLIAKPRGRELRCLTLHSDGRLVAVWPMAIERAGSLHIVRPLGTEGSEYSGPLVEDGPALQERTRRLWKEAMKLGDLVILPNVRADAPLAGVLNEAGLLRARHGRPCPVYRPPRLCRLGGLQEDAEQLAAPQAPSRAPAARRTGRRQFGHRGSVGRRAPARLDAGAEAPLA